MKLINIGFGNMVSANRLIAIVSPESAPIKRIIQDARDRGTLIDATYGRRTRAVLITDSDHVILSAVQPETVANRVVDYEDEEELAADVLSVLQEALDRFVAMREAEGERLRADVLSRLLTLEEHLAFVEERSPQTVAEYRARLTAKLNELLGGAVADEARILTEAAIVADRLAVDEETVRLHSHIAQLRGILDCAEPVGRKLDFLVQEMNRETNTIGSKCSDTAIAGHVVEMKSEIEKIREQIQNIE